MAGYSGTPLPQKLGLKPGSRLVVVDGPAGFADQFPDVAVRARLRHPVDVVALFVTEQRRLEERLPAAMAALADDGGLWVAWPKRASGVPTDLTENTIRDLALEAGMVDNKVCAIDEVWSGLRLVYRLKDRPGRSRTRSAGGR